jgi:hypothetical protein
MRLYGNCISCLSPRVNCIRYVLLIKVFCILRHGVFVTYDPTNNINRSAFMMADYFLFEIGTDFECGLYNFKRQVC